MPFISARLSIVLLTIIYNWRIHMFTESSRPIWLKGREKEVNLKAGFICRFAKDAVCDFTLKMTGSSLVKLYLNSEFLHYGPARGPHGYVRVDELMLPQNLLKILMFCTRV